MSWSVLLTSSYCPFFLNRRGRLHPAQSGGAEFLAGYLKKKQF